jgi:hypothetical protein
MDPGDAEHQNPLQEFFAGFFVDVVESHSTDRHLLDFFIDLAMCDR